MPSASGLVENSPEFLEPVGFHQMHREVGVADQQFTRLVGIKPFGLAEDCISIAMPCSRLPSIRAIAARAAIDSSRCQPAVRCALSQSLVCPVQFLARPGQIAGGSRSGQGRAGVPAPVIAVAPTDAARNYW